MSVVSAKLRFAEPGDDVNPIVNCLCRTSSYPFHLIMKVICSAKMYLYRTDALQWYKPAPFESFDRLVWTRLSPECAFTSYFPTVRGNFYHFDDPVVNNAVWKHFRGSPTEDGIFTPGFSAGSFLSIIQEAFPDSAITNDDIMFLCNSDLSKKYRAWLLHLVGPKSISSCREMIREEANHTLDQWLHECSSGHNIDVSESGQYASRVITSLLLNHSTGSGEICKAINVINWFSLHRVTGRVTDADWVTYRNALKCFRDAIDPIINNPNIPLFKDQEENSLTEAQQKALTFIVFFAGQETTGFLLGNLLLYLAQYPDKQEALWNLLQSDPDAAHQEIESLINFILAKYPPAYVAARRVSLQHDLCLDYRFEGEVEQRKLFIPRGSVLSPRMIPTAQKVIAKAHDKLKQKGGYQAWSPFGSGAHSCPGRYLALAEISEFLNLTLQRCTLSTNNLDEPEVVGRITLQFAESRYISIRPRYPTIGGSY